MAPTAPIVTVEFHAPRTYQTYHAKRVSQARPRNDRHRLPYRTTNHSVEQLVETQHLANRFLRVLSSIPLAHAEAVVLHDLLGHDLAEIARLTEVSVASAQSRLVRGRCKALRRLTVLERRAREK